MLKHTKHCTRNRYSRLWVVATLLLAGVAWAGTYVPLAEDGVHDPANPGIKLLQEPGDALSKLPRDTGGNRVNFTKALQEGLISPQSDPKAEPKIAADGKIDADTEAPAETKVNVLDLDVIMPRTSELPMVRFPHKQHTEWLVCSNCHDKPYKYKAGATVEINMFAILQGEFCGTCHGAVAFPLTECHRCHSEERK